MIEGWCSPNSFSKLWLKNYRGSWRPLALFYLRWWVILALTLSDRDQPPLHKVVDCIRYLEFKILNRSPGHSGSNLNLSVYVFRAMPQHHYVIILICLLWKFHDCANKTHYIWPYLHPFNPSTSTHTPSPEISSARSSHIMTSLRVAARERGEKKYNGDALSHRCCMTNAGEVV